MTGIKVRDTESFDSALRRFKRLVEKSGILSEVRRREFFEKNSTRKQRALAAAIKRSRKKHQRETLDRVGGAKGRGGRGRGSARVHSFNASSRDTPLSGSEADQGSDK